MTSPSVGRLAAAASGAGRERDFGALSLGMVPAGSHGRNRVARSCLRAKNQARADRLRNGGSRLQGTLSSVTTAPAAPCSNSWVWPSTHDRQRGGPAGGPHRSAPWEPQSMPGSPPARESHRQKGSQSHRCPRSSRVRNRRAVAAVPVRCLAPRSPLIAPSPGMVLTQHDIEVTSGVRQRVFSGLLPKRTRAPEALPFRVRRGVEPQSGEATRPSGKRWPP